MFREKRQIFCHGRTSVVNFQNRISNTEFLTIFWILSLRTLLQSVEMRAISLSLVEQSIFVKVRLKISVLSSDVLAHANWADAKLLTGRRVSLEMAATESCWSKRESQWSGIRPRCKRIECRYHLIGDVSAILVDTFFLHPPFYNCKNSDLIGYRAYDVNTSLNNLVLIGQWT